MPRRPGLLLLLGGLCLLPQATGQALPKTLAPSPEPAPAKPAAPEDPLGRTTPYGTGLGFLEAASKGDFKTASLYLDSRLPPAERETLAAQLKLVIDRGLKMDPTNLSHEPEGEMGEDGSPSSRVLFGTARAGMETLDIYLSRVRRGTGPPIWLVSSQTLNELPLFAEQMRPTWLESHLDPLLPERWQHAVVLSVPLSQLTQGLVLLLIGAAGTWILSRLALFAYLRIRFLATKRAATAKSTGLAGPIRLVALIVMVHLLSQLAATFIGRRVLIRTEFILVVIGCVWLGMRVIDALADLAVRRSREAVLAGRLAVIHLARGAAKALLVTIALLIVLATQGVDLSTVVAGIGIGGVALAFASQKTIENLFGTLTFVTDQPARVGDFCKIGEFAGTIESVGMRSSRIRTVEDTVLTVPNGQLSTITLDNISARGKILFKHTLGLSYSTTSDQLGTVLEAIEKLLREHSRIEQSSFRVRLIRFGASSLDVELFAYVLTRDWREFLAIQQGLLIRIMQIVESSGTSIAFPSQTLYFANQPPET